MLQELKQKYTILLFPFFLAITAQAQQKVILDTDIDSDVDDVHAMAVLHALEKKGEIEILGIIVTSDDTHAVACTDVLNTFYNRPDIPIGFLKGQPDLREFSKYTKALSEEFPHDLSAETATDATTLYRKLLTENPDNSITIVTIGHLTNFQNLLKSGPDNISEMDGLTLAHQKVKRWICMGGKFPEGKEANFYRPDPQSTLYSVTHWQKEAIFCGWEVGNEIITGGTYLKNALTENNPVYQAFRLYNDFAGRASWDQVAILMLTEASSRFFIIESGGHVQVNEDGSNIWNTETDTSMRHAFVKIKTGVNPTIIARYLVVPEKRHLAFYQ